MTKLLTNLEAFSFESQLAWGDRPIPAEVPPYHALIYDAPQRPVAAFACEFGGRMDSYFPQEYKVPVDSRLKWLGKLFVSAGLSHAQDRLTEDTDHGQDFAYKMAQGDINGRVANFIVDRAAPLLSKTDVGYFSAKGWMIAHAFMRLPDIRVEVVRSA